MVELLMAGPDWVFLGDMIAAALLVLTVGLLVVAIWALIGQLRTTYGIDRVWRLKDEWDSAAMVKSRKRLARAISATLMLSRGVHPKVASEMLGHSTIAVTLDLYSHVTETMQREAARAIDGLLNDL
jgi:integrase